MPPPERFAGYNAQQKSGAGKASNDEIWRNPHNQSRSPSLEIVH